MAAKTLNDWNKEMSAIFDECRSRSLAYEDAETLTNIAGKGIKALIGEYSREQFLALLELKTSPRLSAPDAIEGTSVKTSQQ